MNIQRFTEIVVAARKRQDELLLKKGADYTRHDPDRLANFKTVAAGLGMKPEQVWAIYFMKHIDAIMAYVKTGKAESEAISGRTDDAINYLLLFEALIEDLAKEKPGPHMIATEVLRRNHPACPPGIPNGRMVYPPHDTIKTDTV